MMLVGRSGGARDVYTSRATDIDCGEGHVHDLSGVEEKREREKHYILCNIYPSCLLIYLALPIPSYDLPVLPSRAYTYIPSDSFTRVSSSSHPPPCSFYQRAPPFLRCSYGLPSHHISAYKTAGASFCLPRDNYRRIVTTSVTPQGGNTRGCNRFAEFPNENCDPVTAPHRLDRRVALVLVGLDTAKFHGGYRNSNFIVK